MIPRRALPLLGALALLQVAAPLWLVYRYETTLRQGHLFRIKVAPIDPVDSFRGRYVSLDLVLPETPLPLETARAEQGQRGWVVLEDGPDGLARMKSFSWTRPPDVDSAPARLRYVWNPGDDPLRGNTRLRAALVLDRYYMNERRAPEVERQVGRVTRVPERAHEAIVRVRVRDGVAAIEGLDLDGTAR